MDDLDDGFTTAREITKRPPDFQFVILRDALIVAIESW